MTRFMAQDEHSVRLLFSTLNEALGSSLKICFCHELGINFGGFYGTMELNINKRTLFLIISIILDI